MNFESGLWRHSGLTWSLIDPVARRWEGLWVGQDGVKIIAWTSCSCACQCAETGGQPPPRMSSPKRLGGNPGSCCNRTQWHPYLGTPQPYHIFLACRLIVFPWLIFPLAILFIGDVLWSALRYLGDEDIDELRNWCMSIQDDRHGEEWREEDGVQWHPVLQLLWSHKIADGGAMEDLCDWEEHIFDNAGKGTLSVDGQHRRIFKGSCEGKGGDSSPQGFFSSGICLKVTWI